MEQEEKQENQNQKKNKHKCSNCGSKFGYLRLKNKTWICRACGNIEKLDNNQNG